MIVYFDTDLRFVHHPKNLIAVTGPATVTRVQQTPVCIQDLIFPTLKLQREYFSCILFQPPVVEETWFFPLTLTAESYSAVWTVKGPKGLIWECTVSDRRLLTVRTNSNTTTVPLPKEGDDTEAITAIPFGSLAEHLSGQLDAKKHMLTF